MCDMAQTYGVFDWRALPLSMAATLAAGLGPGSRCEGARLGLRVPPRDFLAALAADRLALLLYRYAQSDERPQLWSQVMIREQEIEETGAFETAEDFEAWRAQQFKGGDDVA